MIGKKKRNGYEVIENPKPFIHKATKKLVRHIMTIWDDGTPYKLHEFGEVYDMPACRFFKYDEYLEDKGRMFTQGELIDLFEEIKKGWEANSLKGSSDAYMLIKWALARLHIAKDLDLELRWLSITLFFEDEDVFEYDWDIGSHKIELIKKHGLSAFFLSSPIKRYWKPRSISVKDMAILEAQSNAKRESWKELRKMASFLSVPSYDRPD
jgi:hypothetical protein